jgi:hypothetical protein
MIGVCSERLRSRIMAAVSKPSISAMSTFIKMTAQSSFKRHRNASRPELALTID